MAYLIKWMVKSRMLPIFLSAVFLLGIGACAKKMSAPVQPVYQETPAPPVLSQITDIDTQEDEQAVTVSIKGSKVLTYTSVKQPSPLGVVLYFPDTTISTNVSSALQSIESVLIREIKTSELTTSGQTARVEVVLSQDVPYTADRDGNGLKISFAKPNPPIAKASEIATTSPIDDGSGQSENANDKDTEKTISLDGAASATKLSDVSGYEDANHAVVEVTANGAIKNYKSFTLQHPPRIVFELLDLESSHKGEKAVSIGENVVTRARHYAYPDKVRLVIDTKSSCLNNYKAVPTESGLLVTVGGKIAAVVAEKAMPSSSSNLAPPVSPEKEAGWVNRIDFASEKNGKSTVIIGTTAPAKYDIAKVTDTLLHLTLFNTKLPDYRERPLITTRFESAIDRIMPLRKSDSPMDSLFTIELRESVPYFVEQEGNLLKVNFEASTISPQQNEERALPTWQAALEKKPSVQERTLSADSHVMTDDEVEGQNDSVMAEEKKKYSGEKIALDFYETDIKNVFRILKEVSGSNFAIDKDVSGKVTLAFDKPVPWDQVLDLILKMNQLGSTMEGDIVRIATLETLKKEDDDRAAAMAAAQKSKEQALALEPLVTEYIPVNYSNAKSEVLPHIENILTEKRGYASVDERSNLVIVTDVPEKIEKAKDIVRQLDKVTPQVLIEARVVEVSDDFSSDIGIGWGAAQSVQKDFLGGTYDWDVAMNFIGDSDSGIGFTFTRLAGTPLVIDAQLAALETNSQGKIISAPKILTLDNKEATIKQGFQIGYLERDDSGGASVKFKDVDLKLEVTPHVTPDRRVAMEIFISKNDLGTVFNDVPSINTNEAETELLVNDGETIVIGGILKKNESVSGSEFPGLGKVPGLKWLFSKEENSNTKRELLIFITPKIVQLVQR